jgi:hypothetical protein
MDLKELKGVLLLKRYPYVVEYLYHLHSTDRETEVDDEVDELKEN